MEIKSNTLNILLIVAIAGLFSCGDNTVDPPEKKDDNNTDTTGNNNDTTEVLKEFLQFDDYRIEGDQFIEREIKTILSGFNAELGIKWDYWEHTDVPASHIMIALEKLEERDYIPHWLGSDEYNYMGINIVGYHSGTGKFGASSGPPDSLEYGHCKAYEKDGKFVIDVKDVPVVDDNGWEGTISAVLFWEE